MSLYIVQHAGGDVTENVVRFGVGGTLGHEGGDDHLLGVDLQSYFEFLHQANVAVFHDWGDVPLTE